MARAARGWRARCVASNRPREEALSIVLQMAKSGIGMKVIKAKRLHARYTKNSRIERC